MPIDEVRTLLTNFWSEKGDSNKRLAAAGQSGVGAQARNAKHMQSLAAFVRQMFIDAGLDESEVMIDKSIPGYYRRTKNWDVVAMHKGHLVGLVELKSQVGSEGNNANNRIEEALGNIYDVDTAHEINGPFTDTLSVWSAFCVVFGSNPTNAKPVALHRKPLFPIDPEFDRMTYIRQWSIAVKRIVSTGAYSAGWMVTTWIDADGAVNYDEPVSGATVKTLRMEISARVAYAKEALADA